MPAWHGSAGKPMLATPLPGLRARCINGSQVLPAPPPLLARLLSWHVLSMHLLHCDKPSQSMCVTAWTRREGAGARKTTWTRSWDATRASVVASAPWRPWAKRGRPALPPPPAQHRGAPGSHACSKCRQSASQLLRAVASRPLNLPGHSPVPPATSARGGRDGCSGRLCLPSSPLFLVPV